MKILRLLFLLPLLSVAGCGYTTHSLLPSHMKTVYIDSFKNNVDITQEPTDKTGYRIYRPGLENEIAKTIKEKFIFDGALKVVNKREQADLVITGSLLDYRKETLRYDAGENSEEYRIKIIIKIKAEDTKDQSAMWESGQFIGESTYRTTGAQAVSEDVAVSNAVTDLANRVIEKTVQTW